MKYKLTKSQIKKLFLITQTWNHLTNPSFELRWMANGEVALIVYEDHWTALLNKGEKEGTGECHIANGAMYFVTRRGRIRNGRS